MYIYIYIEREDTLLKQNTSKELTNNLCMRRWRRQWWRKRRRRWWWRWRRKR